MDEATKKACDFIVKYHEQLGSMAPDKFSRETQHTIVVLAAYIRKMEPAQ